MRRTVILRSKHPEYTVRRSPGFGQAVEQCPLTTETKPQTQMSTVKLTLGSPQRDGNAPGLFQKRIYSARDLYSGLPIGAGGLNYHL